MSCCLPPQNLPVVHPVAPLPNQLDPRDAGKKLCHVLLTIAGGKLQAHLELQFAHIVQSQAHLVTSTKLLLQPIRTSLSIYAARHQDGQAVAEGVNLVCKQDDKGKRAMKGYKSQR